MGLSARVRGFGFWVQGFGFRARGLISGSFAAASRS